MATGQQITLARPRAPLSHSHRPSRSQVPAFLQKLYEMLNDSNNFHLIRWSEAGDSFIVPNSEHFAREVLGRWFKHQNFQSFVRQLNMYGFHKIPQLQQGVLKSDSDIEIWNFAHPHFRRGEPNLLNFIQRKKQAAQTLQPDGVTEGLPTGAGVVGTINFHDPSNGAGAVGNPTPGQMLDVHSIVNGINAIKHHQSNIQAELAELKQSSQMLWQDAMDVRTKYQKQQDTINKILKFLAGVFGNRANPHKDEGVDALRSRAVIPRRSTRLMIEDGRNKKVGVMDVHDEEENDTTEAQSLGTDAMQDHYASIESSAPSPASSDNVSTPMTESSQLGSYNLSSQPQPSIPPTNPQQPQPPPYPHAAQSAPPSQSQNHSNRALTPSRSPNPSQNFDLQQALGQLTPSQISQLFSLSIDSGLPDNAPPSSASSQLTSYQPTPFDFGHLLRSPEPEQEHDLISFDQTSPILEKQWQVTDDLDKEVNILDSSIHSFMQQMQDMGLDPQQLDAGVGVSLPPMLDSSNQPPPLLPLNTQLPGHLPQSQPPSAATDPSSTLLQMPSVSMHDTEDDFSDMYNFLNLGHDGSPEDNHDAGADGGDASTAFLDNMQVQPESVTETMISAPSPLNSKKSGGKRKSEVALGEVQAQIPVSEPAPTGPPKRGGVKMNMNVGGTATRPAKRRKDK